MKKNYPSSREEAIAIIKKVKPEFYTFSGFEKCVGDYNGEYKFYLLHVLRHMRKVNSSAGRFFGLDD